MSLDAGARERWVAVPDRRPERMRSCCEVTR